MGGLGWLTTENVEFTHQVPLCITRQRVGDTPMGWTSASLCCTIQQKTENTTWGRVSAAKVGACLVPWTSLWVCGQNGWPYLPSNWTGRYIWGWPYLPERVVTTLHDRPGNWGTFKARHRIKHTAWWLYPPAILSHQGASTETQTEVTALALHTTRAFTMTRKALALFNDEVYQMRKVVL